jgi:pimeloyl-ACP methyl ester carboxylesterase
MVADLIRRHVAGAVRTVTHSAAYARHLVRGNAVAGDVSWTTPDGVPVILNHGFLGTRGTMQPLTRRFQRDGRVVFSYSHGKFQLRSIRASAAALVEHMERLQRDLKVSRFDMVGFSMGGLVALHAIKFLHAHRYIRRLALLGTPTDGTWAGLAGVATLGAISPSVWQVLPGSRLLRDLVEAPLPTGIEVRQIHADADAFCPLPRPVAGVRDPEDFIVLPGGHSSLVVAHPFYARLREFFERPGVDATASGLTVPDLAVAP